MIKTNFLQVELNSTNVIIGGMILIALIGGVLGFVFRNNENFFKRAEKILLYIIAEAIIIGVVILFSI